jgi:hypothetical protein
MADTKAKPKATKRKAAQGRTTAKAASGRKTTATAKAASGRKTTATGKAGAAKRTARKTSNRARATALPRDALKSLEEGQRAALDAVRRFAETVEHALPREGGARRQEIVDSALELAERLVQAEYDLLRRLMQSAGKLSDVGKR